MPPWPAGDAPCPGMGMHRCNLQTRAMGSRAIDMQIGKPVVTMALYAILLSDHRFWLSSSMCKIFYPPSSPDPQTGRPELLILFLPVLFSDIYLTRPLAS